MESTSAVSFSFGGRGSHAGGFHGVDACDDMAWVVEKGNVLGLGDDFLVDDLLDFDQLETETEAEGDDDDDDDDDNTKEAEEHQNRNKKYHQIQQQKQEAEGGGGEEAAKQGKQETLGEDSSAVSFEPLPPPVSELTLPAHDAAELEWVSRIMDDSLSEFPTYPAPKLDTHKRTQPFLPPQPMPMATIPVKAKRSKRARTLSWSSSCSSSSSWGSGIPLLFIDSSSAPSSTTTSSTSSSTCSSSSYSSSSSSKQQQQQQQQQQFIFGHQLQLFDELSVSVFPHHPPPNSSKRKSLSLKKQKMPKKRGRKPKSVLLREGAGNSGMSGGRGGGGGGGGERRCSHCGVNKTPQWRTGPDGAKTLCNACGVRYKSGRLVPEYRPACSPTFVSHVHSNSHRKVMEMRRKKEEEESKENNKLLLVSSALPVASF